MELHMVAILFTFIPDDYYFVYIEFHAIAFSIWFWRLFLTLLEHTKSFDHPNFFWGCQIDILELPRSSHMWHLPILNKRNTLVTTNVG
jgi:hypothetical protein